MTGESQLIQKAHIQLAMDGSGVQRQAAHLAKTFGFLNKNALLAAGAIAAVGVVGAAAIAKAVHSALKYENAWAEVRTILTATTAEQEKLNEAVLELSTRVPESAVGLAKGLYQTISAGITRTSDALHVLEVASKTATAGLATTFTAVDVITTVINAFGMRVSEAERVADVLFTTVREGKLTFNTLAGSIGKAIPFFAQAGLRLEELTAAMAALTKGGLDVDIAATALRATVTQILKPAEDAQALARALGIELSATALKSKGLVGFLAELQEKVGNNVAAMAQLFPNVRGLAAILALAGKQNEEYNRILEVTINDQKSMSKAFEIMNETIDAQAGRVKNKLEKGWIDFGNHFLASIGKVLDFFGDLKQSNEELVASATAAQEKWMAVSRDLPPLIKRYEELSKNAARGAKENEELRKVIDEIAGAFPGLISKIDAHGRAIEISTGRVEAYTKALNRARIAEESKAFEKLMETYEKKSKVFRIAKHDIEAATDTLTTWTEKTRTMKDVAEWINKPVGKIPAPKAIEDLDERMRESQTGWTEGFLKGLKKVGDTIGEVLLREPATPDERFIAELRYQGKTLVAVGETAAEAEESLREQVNEYIGEAQVEAEKASLEIESIAAAYASMIDTLDEEDAFLSLFRVGPELEGIDASLVRMKAMFPDLFPAANPMKYSELLEVIKGQLLAIEEERNKITPDEEGIPPLASQAGIKQGVAWLDSKLAQERKKFLDFIHKLGFDISETQMILMEVSNETIVQNLLSAWRELYDERAEMERKLNEEALKDFTERSKDALEFWIRATKAGVQVPPPVRGPAGTMVMGDIDFKRGAEVTEGFDELTSELTLQFGKLEAEVRKNLFSIIAGFSDLESGMEKLTPKLRRRVAEYIRGLMVRFPDKFTDEEREYIAGLTVEKKAKEDSLQGIENLTRGMLQLTASFGVSTEGITTFVSGILNIGSAIKDGASSFSIAGAALGVFGGIISLFGKETVSATEKAKRAKKAVDDFAESLDAISGKDIRKATDAAILLNSIIPVLDQEIKRVSLLQRLYKHLSGSDPFTGDERAKFIREVNEFIKEVLGIELPDESKGDLSVLKAVLEEWFDDLIAKGSAAAKELEQIVEDMGIDIPEGATFEEMVEILKRALEEYEEFIKNIGKIMTDTMGGVLEKLEVQFDLFDIEDPVKKLEMYLAALKEFTGGVVDLTGLMGKTPKDIERAIELITGLITGIIPGLRGESLGESVQATAALEELAGILGVSIQEAQALLMQMINGQMTGDELLQFLEAIEQLSDDQKRAIEEIGEEQISVSRNVSITSDQGDTLIAIGNSMMQLVRDMNTKITQLATAIREGFAALAVAGPGSTTATLTFNNTFNITMGLTESPRAAGMTIAETLHADVEARLRARGVKILGQIG